MWTHRLLLVALLAGCDGTSIVVPDVPDAAVDQPPDQPDTADRIWASCAGVPTFRVTPVAAAPGRIRCDGTHQQRRAGKTWIDDGSCAVTAAGACDAASASPILRWTSGAWGTGSACLPGAVAGFTGTDDEMWAVATALPDITGASVFRWDGRWWTEVATFPTLDARAIWQGADGATWLVGGWTDRTAAAVLRWDGIRWGDLSPSTSDNAGVIATTIHSSTGCTPWIGGAVGKLGTAWQWKGREWRSLRINRLASVAGIWEGAPDDVWATGPAMSTGGWFAHWNGNAISLVARVADASSTGPLFGAASDDLWAAGGHHWDGAAWKDTHTPVTSYWRDGVSLFGSEYGDGCHGKPWTKLYRWAGDSWKPMLDGPGAAFPEMRFPAMFTQATAGSVWFAAGPSPGC